MFRRQFPWFKPFISPWAADHIVPVVERGGECGIENIRTLCLGCHTSVTRELRGRLKQIALDSDSERMDHQAEEYSVEVKQAPGSN